MQVQHSESNANTHKKVFAFFISDLHLCASRPAITEAFLHFLSVDAPQAESLYILGDLFEYWAGDDDLTAPHHEEIITALSALQRQDTKLYLMHGNRDFLIGEAFCKASNATLLTDPTMVHIQGKQLLLSHGDALCTDDTDYQNLRLQFRNSDWQATFLSQPLETRKAIIKDIRLQSEQEKSKKTMLIMDVNSDAVATLLRDQSYPPTFIHGHTHRPNKHVLEIDGHTITRRVLGDWYEQGSYLVLDKHGFRDVMLAKT